MDIVCSTTYRMIRNMRFSAVLKRKYQIWYNIFRMEDDFSHCKTFKLLYAIMIIWNVRCAVFFSHLQFLQADFFQVIPGVFPEIYLFHFYVISRNWKNFLRIKHRSCKYATKLYLASKSSSFTLASTSNGCCFNLRLGYGDIWWT